ncbi:MAG: hypothetical protein OXF02_04270 [Simkaniaceae bacterium]|nr:hypothetical protein [Simkaniaceae bacterium]
MASAIGRGRGVVWPESRQRGTAIWLDDRFGGPPLRFGPLPEGRKNRTYTEEERNAVVDYAVKQRRTKSVDECAKECGATGSSLSRWIGDECRTYPEVAAVKPDVYAGKIADYRGLLVELRQWSGKRPVRLSDHFKDSVGGWGFNRECPPEEEQSRDGHLYFPPAKEGSKRVFSGDEKERTVSYRHSGLGGDSVEKYARECGLFSSTPYEWMDEVGASNSSGLPGDRISPNNECESLRGTSLSGMERLWPISTEEDTSTRFDGNMGEEPPPKRQRQEWCTAKKGTAVWLDNRLGGPPLRFASLPEGRRRRYTEEERGAVLDYVVEQREMKSADECAKDVGISANCISKWLKQACRTYRAFPESDLDEGTLRIIDWRKLLPDLRAGKTPLCIRDYTGGEKYSKDKRGPGRKSAPAKEETRDGRLYFASSEKGKWRVFSEEQKERAVEYWLGEFEGSSISNCAGEINLHVNTLIDWVDTHGCGRRQCALHTAESPGSSPEATGSDPAGAPLPDMPWKEVKRLLSE